MGIALLVAIVLPSFLVSAVACVGLERWAPRWGLVDQPAARKVHLVPTPLGGGLAIWLGCLLPLIVAFLFLEATQAGWLARSWWPAAVQPHLEGLRQQGPKLAMLLGNATILMWLGLIDDKQGLSWQFRLVVQSFVAAATVASVSEAQLTLFWREPVTTRIVSMLWILALINSVNMLDNMDALAGGIGAIASLFFAILMLTTPEAANHGPQWFVATLFLLLLGSLGGFLLFNRPPARIFMGDAGSYFVGYLLAVGAMLGTYAHYGQPSTSHGVLAPLCVLAVPFYDMCSVLAIRIKRGQSIFQADKNHFSHRLVDLGLTKTQAVLTVHLLTATCGLASLLLTQVNHWGALVVMLLIACVLAVIGVIETAARRRARAQQRSQEWPQ